MSKQQAQDFGLRSFHKDRRGAAVVEFVIAFMPLVITFFSFVQLAQISVARLITKHATIIGARAAAVITNEKGNTPDQKQGKNEDEIKKAVKAGLGPLEKYVDSSLKVEITDNSGCNENGPNDPYGLVTVAVHVDYPCGVPLGGRIVCGLSGKHKIDQEFGFPHQGARYHDTPDSNSCGGSGSSNGTGSTCN